ncbi:MAG TPA: TonB-dependent receptor [Gemmatimonadaceae bacterium]|nr:TonB-dependent receptor [Gemmatimonadaceae bacterium]
MRVSALALLVLATPLLAQDTTTKLPPSVTVARGAAKSPLDLPFGISTVSPDSLRPGQAHVSADQTLAMIPGITVSNRTNPSQDVRVSVRGFGARSAFGVRSVRILRDGMPLTLPDGQTPLDYLDLESVGRIEVIRGTASALYGNATGGVVDIRTVVPAHAFRPEARVWLGSDALRRTTAVASGSSGAWTFQGNVGQTEADNYRAYSRQRLTNAFGRIATSFRGTDLSIVGLGLHMPLAENPGALTQAQYDTAPRMADPASISRKARKEVDQVQVGVSAARRLGPVSLSATGYGGTRSLFNPLTFAVVGVDRSISGVSVRGDIDLPADGASLTLGGDFQRQDDDRKNWANCNGVATATANCPTVGQEKGVLQIDQRELVTGGGPYARLAVDRGRLHAAAGVRTDAIRFEVQDRFLGDQDDSGTRTLRATSPMFGLAWRMTRLASVYANYTTAFETPTTTELGNQADGSAGLNRDLLPQYSRTVEAGVKALWRNVTWEISGFHTRVRDELIAFQPPSGRTYYQNAGATRRNGAELSAFTALGPLEAGVAYSYSRFRFEDFNSGGVQMKDNAIPGIPEHQGQVSLLRRFRGNGFVIAEGVAKSRVWANDANTASAAAYQIFNARAGRDFTLASVRVSPTVGVNNLAGVKYVGSVAINATGAAPKFFEPAPGRTWIAGARVWYDR